MPTQATDLSEFIYIREYRVIVEKTADAQPRKIKRLAVKRVQEEIIVVWDFSRLLAVRLDNGTREIVDIVTTPPGAVVRAEVQKGTDASPESIIDGAATIHGTNTNIVRQRIIAGVDKVTYRVICQIETTGNQILEGVGLLLVTDKIRT